MHGWVPGVVQAVSIAMLLVAVGWRSRLWRLFYLPGAAVLGAASAACSSWYIAHAGLTDHPAPHLLWWWTAAAGAAAEMVILGWGSARWWRRSASLLSVPLCLLSAG